MQTMLWTGPRISVVTITHLGLTGRSLKERVDEKSAFNAPTLEHVTSGRNLKAEGENLAAFSYYFNHLESNRRSALATHHWETRQGAETPFGDNLA